MIRQLHFTQLLNHFSRLPTGCSSTCLLAKETGYSIIKVGVKQEWSICLSNKELESRMYQKVIVGFDKLSSPKAVAGDVC